MPDRLGEIATLEAGVAISPALQRPLRGSIAWAIESTLGPAVDVIGVGLLCAELAILGAGVVARYVLGHPLVWSDELAQALFLWLGMIGAAMAVRRSAHMRLTNFVKILPAAWRGTVDAAATMATAGFAIVMLGPAAARVQTQAGITSSALHFNDSLRVAAVLIGFALMAVFALSTLLAAATPRVLARASVAAFLVVAGFAVLGHALAGQGNAALAVFYVGLLGVCIAAGVPIAFAFGAAIAAYLTWGAPIALSVIVGRFDEGMSSIVLLAVPLFVLLGLLIDVNGMARALVDFVDSLFGHMRGGLSYVLIGAVFLVSGISGSKIADLAAVAPALLPEMERRGSDKHEMVGLLAATGAMTETIPPSIALIILGSVTSISISALFTGGFVPALCAGLALVAVVAIRGRSKAAAGSRPSRSVVARRFAWSLPVLVMPFFIRWAVLAGVATATEVSTIAIAYSVIVGLVIYRATEWRRVWPMLVDATTLSGAVLFIVGAATALGWGLTQSGFAAQLAEMMAHVPFGSAGFLAISIVMFIVLGSILEGIPVLVLFAPLVFPIATSMGINAVHYAMVVILAMGVGLFMPPIGVGFHAACAIARMSPDECMPRVYPYLAAVVVALCFVAAFPWVSTGFLK